MDITMDNSLRINRLFLSSVGQWPYQEGYNKLFFFALTIFLLVTQGYLQTGGMIAAWCDPAIFLESIPPVLISLMCVVKLINFIYNADKMKELLNAIKVEWETLTNEKEIEILRQWTIDSRKNTIFYAVAVYGSMVPFMLGPLVPLVMMLIPENLLPDNPNATIHKPLMFHVEYLIDVDTYYYPLVIHSYFGTMAYITVVVAIDTMFMVYVQHACAIFVIIGHRLEYLVDANMINVDMNLPMIEDEAYAKIIDCIVKHSKTLQYAQSIESANSKSFLVQLGINMICISFTGFQSAVKLDRPDEAFRYASFAIAQTFHLFFESWPSQRLVDESARINEYTTRTPWYNTSIRCRKLFLLLIMRSSVPCQLTAGNFYDLNLENFSAVVRSSMSMFTLLTSTQ